MTCSFRLSARSPKARIGAKPPCIRALAASDDTDDEKTLEDRAGAHGRLAGIREETSKGNTQRHRLA